MTTLADAVDLLDLLDGYPRRVPSQEERTTLHRSFRQAAECHDPSLVAEWLDYFLTLDKYFPDHTIEAALGFAEAPGSSRDILDSSLFFLTCRRSHPPPLTDSQRRRWIRCLAATATWRPNSIVTLEQDDETRVVSRRVILEALRSDDLEIVAAAVFAARVGLDPDFVPTDDVIACIERTTLSPGYSARSGSLCLGQAQLLFVHDRNHVIIRRLVEKALTLGLDDWDEEDAESLLERLDRGG